jgi:hypothetical protein
VKCTHWALFILVVSPCLAAQNSATEDMEFNWLNSYQQGAVEDLLNTGRSLLEESEYASAGKIFLEALQNIKVNNGMDSSLQAPVLELLIQALLPHKNWAITNQYLSYFQWLNSKAMQTNFDSYLKGADAPAKLYLRAAADPQNPHTAHYVVTARNLTWNAISAIESLAGKQNP